MFYGAKGLQYRSDGNASDLWLGLRFQTRYDTIKNSVITVEQLKGHKHSGLNLNRGRVKGGGTLWVPWLTVYSEYDFKDDNYLDWRATLNYGGWLDLRLGQWKSEFNRERIDSSGKQQLVERSVSNYWFTLDRQRGVTLSPRFAKGTPWDTRLWLGALSGQGRTADFENGEALWLLRAQWNPAGEMLAFSQSALQHYDSPVTAITLAGVYGDTPYTRFSTAGGGDLPGYTEGDYRLRQLMFETAVHYRGLAWQQELHYKEVRDKRIGENRTMFGGYAQLGSFPSQWWPAVPPPLEFVARLAYVDPDNPGESTQQREYTLGVNWFFNGHRNKLTADVSRLDYRASGDRHEEGRFRVQWELSL